MSFIGKIRKLTLLPIRKMQFADFGKHSDIFHPIMILGKAYIHIGDRTTIRYGARIEAIQEYMGDTFSPNLVIGNHVMIEQGSHIVCSSNLTIEDNTTISSYVFISDTSHIIEPAGKSILENPITNKDVHIGKACFIGTGAKIMPGVDIGDFSVIGANAVVTHSIPSNSLAIGVPAKVIKVYKKEGRKWEKL